jgi:hypothetical protein
VSGRLRPTSLVYGGVVAASIAIVVAIFLLWVRPKRGWVGAVLLAASVLIALGIGSRTSDPTGDHMTTRLQKNWRPYVFIANHYPDSRIAVTGTNQSSRAYGSRFTNRVRYININDREGALFHHHFKRVGLLQDKKGLDRTGHGYYRSDPSPEAWLRNLEAFGANLLLVSRMPMRKRSPERSVQAGEGFPLEESWASERPERFTKVFANEKVRIYEVSE